MMGFKKYFDSLLLSLVFGYCVVSAPPVLALDCGTSSAQLQLKEYSNSCGANQVQDIFEIVNNDGPVTLSDITIKFWTDETSTSNLTGSIFNGGCLMNPSCFHQVSGLSISAAKFSPACGPDSTHQANWEITVSTTDHTVLSHGVSWTNIQTSIHRADWQNFSPGTGHWYSPCVGNGNYTNDLHYAIYLKGNLVTASGGLPPDCKAPATCTPTFTFTPTSTFTLTPTPTIAVIPLRTPNGGTNEVDDPASREQWFRHGRTSQDGLSAAEHWMNALKQAQNVPVVAGMNPSSKTVFSPMAPRPSAPMAPSSCDWIDNGPAPLIFPASMNLYGNVSGRVTSLAYDLTNNIVYLGSAFGGVWKSLNGGTSWTPISDINQSLAVGSIALDPTNPAIIYNATGEANSSSDSYYGVGITKSTNSGVNWVPPVSTAASSPNIGTVSLMGLSFSKILVDPLNNLIVLAAGKSNGLASSLTSPFRHFGGIYRSADGGGTWTLLLPPAIFATGTAYPCTDIAYDSINHIYYAAFTTMGVFKSIDQGANWTQAASPFANYAATVPYADGTPLFARASLAARNGILWALISDGFGDPAVPTLGTDTGLVQSIDQGASWTRINLPVVAGGNLFNAGGGSQGFYDQYVAAPPGGTGLVVAGIDVWSTGVVGTSPTWTNLSRAYSGGLVHPDQHAIVMKDALNWFIGCDGGVWSTSNAGTGWSDQNTNLGTIQFTSVSPDLETATSDVFFGGAQDNGTSKKRTGSLTWDVALGGDGGFTDNNPFNPLEYLSEQFNISLAHSFNSGGSFSTVLASANLSNDNSAFYIPFKSTPLSSAVVLGTTRIWKGPPDTSTGWSPISPFLVTNGSTGRFIQAVEADSSALTIYASTSDFTTNTFRVWATLNNASSWNDVTGNLPTNRPINCLAMDESSTSANSLVYAAIQGFANGAGGHVFKSSISAPTVWTDISGNLPDAPANWILVDPADHTNLYVATDVGVFVTQNNGVLWSRTGTLLPESAIFQLKTSNNCPRSIIATTHGRGAWTFCPLATNYTFIKQWDGTGTPEGALNFGGITGVAVVGGFVYVADVKNGRIHKYDLNGTYITSLGGPGTAPGQFSNPFALAADPNPAAKKLYVLEQGPLGGSSLPRVQVLDITSGVWSNFITATGLGGNGKLFGPRAIAVDSTNGDVYVSDTQSGSGTGIIQKFTSAGAWQAQQQVDTAGIALDSNNRVLYATGQFDHIQKFNILTTTSTPFLTPGTPTGWGTTTAGFISVAVLGVGPDGNVYESIGGGATGETGPIEIFSPTGNFITQLVMGPSGPTGGPGNYAGLAVDSCSNVYASRPGEGFMEKQGLCGSTCIPASSVRPFSGTVGNEGGKTATPTSTPTVSPTVTATPTIGVAAVVAVPNISRNGDPVKFQVALPKSAKVHLMLFTIMGEQVYQTSMEGNAGVNTLVWNVQNQANQAVASGLYLYVLEIDDGVSKTRRMGKVAVLR